MAKVLLEDWKEQYRDERIERMSRDEMSALQSERLVKQVKNVYEHVSFYKKKMDDLGVEPGDIKGIEDITKLPFTTKEDLSAISSAMIPEIVAALVFPGIAIISRPTEHTQVMASSFSRFNAPSVTASIIP